MKGMSATIAIFVERLHVMLSVSIDVAKTLTLETVTPILEYVRTKVKEQCLNHFLLGDGPISS